MTRYRSGLPDDALQIVGGIAVECGDLESAVTSLIASLASPLNHSPMVQVLLQDDGFNTKVDTLKLFAGESGRSINGRAAGVSASREGASSVPVLSDQRRAELRSVVADLDRLRVRRNKIIHGTWSTESEWEEEFQLFSSRGPVKDGQETWSRADLASVLRLAREVNRRVRALEHKLLQAQVADVTCAGGHVSMDSLGAFSHATG